MIDLNGGRTGVLTGFIAKEERRISSSLNIV